MPSPLKTGKWLQDHKDIGKAAELPGVATGQFVSIAPVTLPKPGRPVELQMRVTAPTAGQDLPIILLSHGYGPSNHISSLNGYLPTAQFYAAHGFVVIQPTHLFSRSVTIPEGDQPEAPMFWHSRVTDMKTILDGLDELEEAVSFVKGRLDRSRVAVWGHSMGSHTAAALLGMRATDDGREYTDLNDPRVKAGVILGGVGSGKGLSERAGEQFPVFKTTDFSHMTTPTLVVSGDKDNHPNLSTVGWKWSAQGYELGPGPKDLLVMHGGNHSFGGISGWDSTDCKLFEEESPEMCAATLRLTLAYLRSALYEGDSSWVEAQKALEQTGMGHVESK